MKLKNDAKREIDEHDKHDEHTNDDKRCYWWTWNNENVNGEIDEFEDNGDNDEAYANYEIKTNQIITRMMKKMHMMREIEMMNIKT